MAFSTRLFSIIPSFGVPLQNDAGYLRSGVALGGADPSVVIPVSSTFSPTISSGYVRVKVYNATGTTTLTTVNITITDGTTTETIYNYTPDSADAVIPSSTAWFDATVPFLSELQVNKVTIQCRRAASAGGVTIDAEVCGASGTS